MKKEESNVERCVPNILIAFYPYTLTAAVDINVSFNFTVIDDGVYFNESFIGQTSW